jgi:uncharacterized protein
MAERAAALRQHEELIAGLLRPEAYPTPVDRIERLDTHISTVLLAGDYAYKIKKPVAFGFLDFSSLELRRQYCEEELRINRRTAPQIYLDVVPIIETRAGLRIGAPGEKAGGQGTVDYAVSMRRFDNERALDRLATQGRLSADHIDQLASAVARLHEKAERAPPGFGTQAVIARWSEENFASLRARTLSAVDRARVDALAAWSKAELAARSSLLDARVERGFIREGHGDLHLANIVLIENDPVPFDALEFNAELRYIDVVSDVAFTFMDLADHRLPQLAWRFINIYLEHTGDYDSLALLRFYSIYRALVRANVALIHLQQPQLAQVARLREHASFEHYLVLAEQFRELRAPVLLVMSGLSGSGKSTVALQLAEQLGAIRIRSDVERKRLQGLARDARSDGTIYTAGITEQTYARLADAARAAIAASVPAIVDAAFLRRAERARFRRLAAELNARYLLINCEAPLDVLRARVAERAARGADPSEANLEVLEKQLLWHEPLDAEEEATAIRIHTANLADEVQRISRTLQQ